MDSPFSLLIEWVTSPQVVGSFVISAVGLVLSGIFLFLSYWADKRGLEGISFVLCFIGVLALGVMIVCLCAFNHWCVGVL